MTVESPGHLSPAGQAWWAATAANYKLEEHHRHVLTAAVEAWDRMNEARGILADDGPVYRDRFGAPRKHPAVSVEENARVAFLRALRELDLDDDAPPDPRIPRR